MPLNLQQTQQAFVHAIRYEQSQNLPASPMKIYARLIRNNCFSFIDRCFTESAPHCGEEWNIAKEHFLQKGKAHSPFFQDIAAQFLDFCRTQSYFKQEILALMDFEQTQLQAEVIQAQIPQAQNYAITEPMQLSPAAFLREYTVDFLTQGFQQFLPQPIQVIIWRDAQFDVYHKQLTAVDFWLLNYMSEQSCSWQQLQQEFNQLPDFNTSMLHLLQQTWQKWIAAEVIIPTNMDLS